MSQPAVQIQPGDLADALTVIEEKMAHYRALYRKGDTKPGAMFVTPAQFDALCDINAIVSEELARMWKRQCDLVSERDEAEAERDRLLAQNRELREALNGATRVCRSIVELFEREPKTPFGGICDSARAALAKSEGRGAE